MLLSRLLARLFFILIVTLPIAACSDNEMDRTPANVTKQTDAPTLEVFKSPSCGCCGLWINHIEENGFHAISKNMENRADLKFRKGIRPALQSCHTAISDDRYVFEGHVPAKYIHQFLDNPPQGAIGLSVPGMPLGTPGMEAADNFSPYEIILLKSDGSVEVYALINSAKEQVL